MEMCVHAARCLIVNMLLWGQQAPVHFLLDIANLKFPISPAVQLEVIKCLTSGQWNVGK